MVLRLNLQSSEWVPNGGSTMTANTQIRADRSVLAETARFRPFPLEEYEDRWERTLAHMKQKGYETAVVVGKTCGVYERAGDVLYLTNFFSTHSGQEPDTALWNARGFCFVIMQQGEVPELVTDEADGRTDLIATHRFQGTYDPIKALADTLKQRGVTGKVALVGADTLPMKYWLQLEPETGDIDWVQEEDLIRDVRLVKSDREIAIFREAGELVTKAHIKMMEALIAGKTEAEAASIAGSILLAGGGAWHRIALSHAETSNFLESDPLRGFSVEAPRKGDIIHGFIYGPILKGHWLDPGRTAVCGGKPTPAQKKLVESLVNMMHKLMDEIRPGVRFKDVAEIGDRMTEESGYYSEELKTNWPYYGHMNGCMWEPPYIEPRLCNDDDVFLENQVGSVEGFFECPEAGSAVFETNYVVTKDGVEEITPVPHIFW